MDGVIQVKNYAEPPYNEREILRYAGAKEATAEVKELLRACLEEAKGKPDYRVCYAEFPVTVDKNRVNLSFAETVSENLSKNLRGCKKIVVFAATVGIGIDRLIAKYSVVSPAKALMFQAIGAERIESLCDSFNADIEKRAKASGCGTRPRFSPGYGDVSLSLQTEIIRVLDCNRKIGVTLNKSMLMSPSKTVTAIIGITDGESGVGENGCKACAKEECVYRRQL